MNHQQQQEPPAAAEPAAEPAAPTPSKQRLISPELIAEKFDEKRQANERMKLWLESVKSGKDF